MPRVKPFTTLTNDEADLSRRPSTDLTRTQLLWRETLIISALTDREREKERDRVFFFNLVNTMMPSRKLLCRDLLLNKFTLHISSIFLFFLSVRNLIVYL